MCCKDYCGGWACFFCSLMMCLATTWVPTWVPRDGGCAKKHQETLLPWSSIPTMICSGVWTLLMESDGIWWTSQDLPYSARSWGTCEHVHFPTAAYPIWEYHENKRFQELPKTLWYPDQPGWKPSRRWWTRCYRIMFCGQCKHANIYSPAVPQTMVGPCFMAQQELPWWSWPSLKDW